MASLSQKKKKKKKKKKTKYSSLFQFCECALCSQWSYLLESIDNMQYQQKRHLVANRTKKKKKKKKKKKIQQTNQDDTAIETLCKLLPVLGWL